MRTFDELRAEVERANAEADKRDGLAYASYAQFCQRLQIDPPSFERWQAMRGLTPSMSDRNNYQPLITTDRALLH